MNKLGNCVRKAKGLWLLLLLAVICTLMPQMTQSKYVLEKTVGTFTLTVTEPLSLQSEATPEQAEVPEPEEVPEQGEIPEPAEVPGDAEAGDATEPEQPPAPDAADEAGTS